MWERRADTARKRVSMRQLESQRVCEKFLKLELEHNTEACLRLNVVMLQLLVQQLLLCADTVAATLLAAVLLCGSQERGWQAWCCDAAAVGAAAALLTARYAVGYCVAVWCTGEWVCNVEGKDLTAAAEQLYAGLKDMHLLQQLPQPLL
eukprot:1158038-Pelagomonas_calceolata.AAC.2